MVYETAILISVFSFSIICFILSFQFNEEKTKWYRFLFITFSVFVLLIGINITGQVIDSSSLSLTQKDTMQIYINVLNIIVIIILFILIFILGLLQLIKDILQKNSEVTNKNKRLIEEIE